MEPIRWVRGARTTDAISAVYSGPPGSWLIFSLSPGHDPTRETGGSPAEFLAAPGELLVVLDPRLTVLGPEALSGPISEALGRPGLLTLLVPPGTPPPVTGVNHGPVRAFVGPASLLHALPVGPAELTPETLCYWALWSVMHGAEAGVVARECPAKQDDLPPWTPSATPSRLGPTVLVMAHRGPPEFLAAALRGLSESDPGPDVVRVGLDVDSDDMGAYRVMVESFPGVEFYAGSHAPVGPYMIRQALGTMAAERFLVFHDSDDHSTRDRFHWLHAEMERGGTALVGSHELRYDEDDREVRAVRFPLDVTAALTVEPKHPQLHPTTMVAAADFRRAGGFSTDCIFGNDTQFMLRAFFHLPLRNVDRFLYIRRDRWESLTNAPETGMNNPLRIARNLTWWSHFQAVKAGWLPLVDSSLMTVDGRAGWELRRLYSYPDGGSHRAATLHANERGAGR
jgi:hypothetical protein